MKQAYLLIIFSVVMNAVIAQTGNVGIGTTSPTTKFDVNGAYTYREGGPITVSGTTATISDLSFSQYRLTGSPTAAFTITGPTTSNGTTALLAGARMILVNATSQPGALNGSSILPGSAQEFTYSNGGWIAIRNPGAAIGLFAKSAGTQLINGAQVINDWVVTTNDFGSSWNGSVFTVPVGMQGWYSIAAGYSVSQSFGGGLRTPAQHVIIRVNGSEIMRGTAAIFVNGGTINGQAPGTGSANASMNYFLNAGDQVSIVGNQLSILTSSGASTSAPAEPVNTYLSILKQ